MSVAIQLQRPTYKPSGRFSPLLVLSAGVLLVVALICGFLLALSGMAMYMMIASPAIAAAALGGIGYFLLRASHCRSPALAALLMGGLGMVVYLFQFPAEVAIRETPIALLRVDLWPSFVVGLVNAWQIGHGVGNAGAAVPVFNWIFFAVELFISAMIPGAMAAFAASPCYCERCRKWMTKKSAKVAPDSASLIVLALQEGNLAGLAPFGPSITADHALLEVEGCSHGGQDAEATFYLTARESRGAGENVKLTTLAEKALLTPDEFITLVEKCPILAGG